jgi:hypothetical protein
MSPLGQSAFDVQMAWPPAEQLAAQADWNAPPSASIAQQTSPEGQLDAPLQLNGCPPSVHAPMGVHDRVTPPVPSATQQTCVDESQDA